MLSRDRYCNLSGQQILPGKSYKRRRFDDFAYIDMDSGEWEFRSGLIAYLLDDDGNYRLEWINP